jgi:cholesterol oxidase
MDRLSNEGSPRDSYDVVIIGSGYGGSIAASRLARAKGPNGVKPSVCVLERGREWGLGEFPDTTLEAVENMQTDLPAKHWGSSLGLFDFRVNEDINVLVGCGLGGTSLINANVSIAPDRRVFDDKQWPSRIRKEFGAANTPLTRGYDRAMSMLRPVAYPDSDGYAPLKKLSALEKSASHIGQRKFYRPQINVNFVDQTNHAGVFQPACNRCGDCVSGCNTGAKNTLAMNYLPDAKRHGAEIFTEVAVRFVEPEKDGWTVHYDPVGRGRSRFGAPNPFVRAKVVIIAAGSLGSTEILLRSRARGLKLSKQLGHRFTGNGDVLGFGYNNDVVMNGIGCGPATPDKTDAPGPCITGIIDERDTQALDDGFVIEEGSIPGALSGFIPAMLSVASRLGGQDTDSGIKDLVRERIREADSLVRGPRTGAVRNTQTYLVMAHDASEGVMDLDDDRVRIAWPGVGKQDIFRKINNRLRDCTSAHGGTYVTNPVWNKIMGHDLVTVHPLGGCPMADDATAGVVNHAGQVFSSSRGEKVHDGLYVTDGAVIPRSLGVNPLLTISAIAERTCELLAADRGWMVDYAMLEPVLGKAPEVRVERRKSGVRFTETMRGEYFADVAEPTPDVLRRRLGSGTPMEFTLTVDIPDVDEMIRDPLHPGQLSGTVTAPGISAEPLRVSGGEFNLFMQVPGDPPDTRRMRYRFTMSSEEGEEFQFEGNKLVHDDRGLDSWSDLTTLFVAVRRVVDGKPDDVIGCALLHIRVSDFRRQLGTMMATNARDRKHALATLWKFGTFFNRVVFETYGGIFAPSEIFNKEAEPRKPRALRAPEPELHWFSTPDNVRLLLTRFKAGNKGPVLLAHGLGVSSRIFSIDTIDTNLVEHLAAFGYDVWNLDFRASISLPASRQQFSGDEIAKYDYPAAVAEIRRITGARTVQVIGHCFGASTVTMSLLAGLQDVRSVVLSQVSLDVVAPPVTRVKTGLHLPDALKAIGIERLDAEADNKEGWALRLFDKALKLQPVQAEERCRSSTCHRITFMYAPLYEHDQLNDATHDVLPELFGEANMRSFIHLGAIVRAGKLVSVTGADDYEPHLSRLNLPITFISGEENACFLPESTQRTYERLRTTFDRRQYRRHVIPNYGHIDCMFGKNAARDVFPYIVESLEAYPS